MKHDRAILCDALTSIEKTRLTGDVGELSADKLRELDGAVAGALSLPPLSQP